MISNQIAACQKKSHLVMLKDESHPPQYHLETFSLQLCPSSSQWISTILSRLHLSDPPSSPGDLWLLQPETSIIITITAVRVSVL